MQFADLKESNKIIIMAALFSGACLLTYYYHAILDTDVIFTHLFYIPIALASIWWRRRGIAAAVLLGVLLVVSHVIFAPDLPLIPDLCRAAIFVVISSAIALLSEQIAAAGSLYETLAGSSHTGIYIHQNGKLKYLNQHALEYTGFSESELMQMSPLDPIHPDDREEAQKNAVQMLKGVRKAPYEFRLITGDGKIKWIMETVTPIQFKGRKAVLGNAMDITDRKKNQDILEQYRTQMELILKSVGDGVYGVDVNGNTTFVNPSAAELSGYHAEEMIGRDLHDMIHHSKPDGTPYPSDACKVRLTVKDGVTRRVVDEVFWKKDGTPFFVEYIVTPIFEKNGIAGAVIAFRDITERKRAEESVKIANQRFSEVFNSLDALVYVTDMKTHELLFINKYGRDIWGDIEGEICWQTIQEGQEGPCEFCTNDRLVDADGKPTGVLVWEFQNTVNKHWYECRDRAIYWPDGRVVRIEIASDITERKQVDNALRQSEEKYRTILENIEDGYHEVNLTGSFTFFNESFRKMMGYASDELMGMNYRQYAADPENARKIYLAYNKLYKTGKPIRRFEWDIIRKDGERRTIDVSATLIRDGEGRPTGFRGIVRDTTERMLAERALRESESRQKAILDNIPDIAWLKDRESRFIAVNEPFGKVCGVAPDELVGKTDLDIWPHELAERYRADDREVVLTGLRKSVEEPLMDKEGRATWIETIKTPIWSEKGEIIGTTGIARDITERKKTENELKKAYKELQDTKDMLIQSGRLAALGQLASGAAHEIRNPLNIMSLWVQTLEKTESLSEKIAKAFESFKVQIQRIVKIIDGLRTFASLPVGEKKERDINQVIEHVLRVAGPRMIMEEVVLEKELTDGLPALYVDVGRIEQMLMHVVNNALDAMKDKAVRKLSFKTGLHSADQDMKMIRVEVSDTGHGIAPENISRIFDPFFTTKGPDKGTGLGLSIAYSIVQDHGGRIWAENNEWGGATFFIELPV